MAMKYFISDEVLSSRADFALKFPINSVAITWRCGRSYLTALLSNGVLTPRLPCRAGKNSDLLRLLNPKARVVPSSDWIVVCMKLWPRFLGLGNSKCILYIMYIVK